MAGVFSASGKKAGGEQVRERVVVNVASDPNKSPYLKSFCVLLCSLVLIGCGESSSGNSIRQLGSIVERGDTTEEVTMVRLSDTQITDAGLSEIKAALPNYTVKLSNTSMEDLTMAAMFRSETWKRT